MALITYKPTSAGRRGLIAVDRSGLAKGGPEASLVVAMKNTGGRNNTGAVTSWQRGGGHKRKYRLVDFKRAKEGEATVTRLEYDPNRTAFIALIEYKDGEKSYILAPQRLKAGDKVATGQNVDILPGNALPLKNIPVGTVIHNIEMKPGKGGQIARSAGAYAQVVGKDGAYVMLRLMSGEQRLVFDGCMATIGAVSNPDHSNTQIGKAGRNRWKGWRPHVRGTAMNPIDHPHGGGEGRTKGGRHPVSPWGQPTKGFRTRSKRKPSGKFIARSRHKQ